MFAAFANKLQTYYLSRRIAGKLNLGLSVLLVFFLVNGLISALTLYQAHKRSVDLENIEQFGRNVRDSELALLRFRLSHQRADALKVKELLDDSRQLLRLMPSSLTGQAEPSGVTRLSDLLDAFEAQFFLYLDFFDQMSAVQSAMSRESAELIASLQILRRTDVSGDLQPVLTALVEAVNGAGQIRQEFLITRNMDLAEHMENRIRSIVASTSRLRSRSRNVETQLEAYATSQAALSMGSAFEKLRSLTRSSLIAEERMAETSAMMYSRAEVATHRFHELIMMQIFLLVGSTMVFSAVIVVFGYLLGRRFVQGITAPIGELLRRSRLIARGNYEQRVEVSTQDEIGELASSFNEMTRTVQQHVTRLQESDVQIRLRTADLEVANWALALAKGEAEDLNASLESMVQERTTELEEANRKLNELTVTDALTGLANRRRFDHVFAEEWSRAARTGIPLAVLMIDIDFFKAYNDNYGHQAGDVCLRQVAQTLQGSARRAGDLVSRYGGEEFIVVASHLHEPAAREHAESMRRAVESLNIRHDFSSVSTVVTISIGVAVVCPDSEMQSEKLLRQADDALYRAKNAGRNRVVLS